MRRISDSPFAAMFVGLVLLLGMYVGTYYAAVDTAAVFAAHGPTSNVPYVYPDYWPHSGGVCQTAAERLFWPIHKIDKEFVRQNVWDGSNWNK